MKSIFISFSQMLRQMKHDIMLITVLFVPFIAGLTFRFLIPVVEHLLTGYFNKGVILASYYELFDLFLMLLTSSMLNYVAAMVILEEADDHMIAYLAITPLGKTGYLFSRLGITGLISFPLNILIALLFHLSHINILLLIGIAFVGAIQGVVVALLIVALSTNKVEGMAVGKMASLFSLGALAPYFVVGKAQYLLAVFPSFWIAKTMQASSYFTLLISILLAVLWIVLLSEKFMKKITG